MATDVHRRGHGRSFEGLSVVAGAAHLIPAEAGPKNNAQAALLRASYQQYVGVSSTPGDAAAGQLSMRHSRLDSFGPKLVQGDYTYTTSRKSLLISPQLVGGGGSLPPGGTAPSSVPSSATVPSRSGTIPAMVPMNASNINTAAWKAYGSPSARNHQRPPLAPAGGGAAPASPTGNKLPRVGGFKPHRPQSAPGNGGTAADLGPVIAAIASSVSVSTMVTGRRGSKGPELMDVGVLAVEPPDPIRAGRTDSGKVMFEYTQPTDPYAKYVWEEQARKARGNMSRHVAAMAVAAAVNGGNPTSFAPAAASAAGGGGAAASRPGSAARPAAAGAAASMSAMRPRFSSTTIAEVARQGPDHKPPTVVGFAAPDLTEDSTLPGPGDPRWAYTRLGRTQISRLQNSLKMAAYHPRLATRPSSAPALGGAGGSAAGVGVGTDTSSGGVGVGVGSPERSMARHELSALDPFSDPSQGGAVAAAAGSGSGGRVSEQQLLEGQRSSPAAMLRSASGSGGTRPGSAGRVRPGSATYGSFARAGSPGLPRPGSAGLIRPASSTGPGGAAGLAVGASSISLAAALAAEASSAAAPAVPPVRGASAGRTRESAPNPRVDLRAYLADAEADAEDDDDEGTEMLPVGDLAAAAAAATGLVYDGASGAVLVDGVPVPVPPEVLQSMPVPADQLAARLAEMVAAVAVVAAQKQIDGEGGEEDDGGDGGGDDDGGEHPYSHSQPHVKFQEDFHHDADERDTVAVPPHPLPPHPSLEPRFSRPDGDDALVALHGASQFGRAGPGRFSNNAVDFAAGRSSSGSGQYDSDGIAEWGDGDAPPPLEQPLGLGLGLGLAPRPGSRAGGGGRPTSARPMSARPTTARPTSAMPGRRSGSPTRGLGGGGLEGGGGMDVIMEQSEGTVGEEC